MCLYPATQSLGTRGGSERGGGSEASARSGRGETGHPAAPTRVAGRRGGAPAWPSWLAPTRGQGSPSPLRPPALRSSEAHVLLEPESGCSADRADHSTSVRRRRPPPGTAGGRDTVSRAGGAAPGDPFPLLLSSLHTPRSDTGQPLGQGFLQDAEQKPHSPGRRFLSLSSPSCPEDQRSPGGFSEKEQRFFFSFGWEQTVFSTSEKHKEQKTKTRGNMAGAGFRPAHPPTRLLVGVTGLLRAGAAQVLGTEP